MNNSQNDRGGRPAGGSTPRREAQRQQSYPRQRPPQPTGGQRPAQRSTPTGGGRPASQGGGYRPTPGHRSPDRHAQQSYRSYGRKSSNDYLVWFLAIAIVLLIALIVTYIIVRNMDGKPAETEPPVSSSPSIPVGPATPEPEEELKGPDGAALPNWKYKPSSMKAFVPQSTAATEFAEGLNSEYGIIVSLSDSKVLASKKADEKMYPASMTKIMTVIVACENIADMTETFTITESMRIPLDNMGASMAYFETDQPIYMIDLIYGAWLPSGADATAALAVKIAGSEAEFVKLMNAKAAEIGCTGTHFANVTGLHDENNYSTVRDMATILSYAVQNPLIKAVLSAKTYETYATLEKETENHKLYATWYLTLSSMAGDYSFFVGAKTGYEDAAGSCMASLIRDEAGNEYVVVTGKAVYTDAGSGKGNAFRDVKTLYDNYVK